MATYRGSGNFVGIIAGSRIYYESDIKGIFFGNKPSASSGEKIYCTVAPKYTQSGSSITKNALEIEPGWTLPDGNNTSTQEPLYLGTSNSLHICVNGYTGYSGTIRVAQSVTVDSQYKTKTNYYSYTFVNGFLCTS